jgi:hypothetical protein
MKIVFLCSSLESGRNGVGDYTSKLSLELIRQGHDVFAIALNDTYRTTIVEDERHMENHKFVLLRLPSKLSSKRRINIAQENIQKYNPNWISLQFVIYSYHPKGLPFGLGKLLKNLGEDFNWHIMFHETWIGISKISPLKQKIIGFFQKRIILSMIKSIQPQIITTSNILYKLALKSININSTILAMFSNIDIASKNEPFICSFLNSLGLESEKELLNWEIIGIFGHLHPDANLEPILKERLALCETRQLKIAFVAFGKIGDKGILEFERLERIFSTNIKFLYLGEQRPEIVSNILQLINIGISCTQLPYIGKSGVFAAMKLHGLDVIVPEDKVFPEYEHEIKKYQFETASQDAENWNVIRISEKLIDLLLTVEK